jgi:bifunctional oligoribonuclease and PAP phosphatase NrnA
MRKDSFKKFKDTIKKANHIGIVTHWSPDGDAMGSSLALYHYLKALGKTVHVMVPNAYPDFLTWLPGDKNVLNFQKDEKKMMNVLKKVDVLFTLDFNSFKRLEKLGELLALHPAKKIIIDHHQQPDDYGTLYFHDVLATSTCELIFDFIVGMGDKKLIDKKIAACIYTGMMTDTGSFRYPGVNAHTHRIVADLLETGIVPGDIHSAIYDTYSENRMKLLGYVLTNKMVVLADKGVAYMSLTEKELNQFKYQKGDTEGIVNYPFGIKGITFCALFTESDGIIKISFRSKGKRDVNSFARTHFSGGGHINAAGGKSNSSLNDTIARFLKLINS